MSKFLRPSHHTSLFEGTEKVVPPTEDIDIPVDTTPYVSLSSVLEDMHKTNAKLSDYNWKTLKSFSGSIATLFSSFFVPASFRISGLMRTYLSQKVYFKTHDDVPEDLKDWSYPDLEDEEPSVSTPLRQRIVFQDAATDEYYAYIPESLSWFGYKINPARVERLS